jgi:hypothetical protein
MSFHWLATNAANDAASSHSALRVMVLLLPPVRLNPPFPLAGRANREH